MATITTPESLLDRETGNAENNVKHAASLDSLDSVAACYCCNPLENLLPDLLAVKGQSFDTIVVLSKTTCRVASSDFFLFFDHPVYPFPPHVASTRSLMMGNSSSNIATVVEANHQCEALLELIDDELGKVYFAIEHDPVHKKNRLRQSPSCQCMEQSESDRRRRTCENVHDKCNPQQTHHYQQKQPFDTQAQEEQGQDSLMLLARMLKPGKNSVRYLFRNDKRVLGIAQAAIFLWSEHDRVVVCDVDGTITKSNVRGIYDSIVTEKYGHCHDRVCRFLSSLKCGLDPQEEGSEESPHINIVYLSSRPLFIADSTRRFLSSLRQPLADFEKQNEQQSNATEDDSTETERASLSQHQHHRLPDGPLIGFGGKLSEVLKMELVTHTVHLFKASQLINQVVTPFCRVTLDPEEKHRSLFVAGFGNTFMDVQAYHMAGMSLDQIYLIDKKSRITCMDAGVDTVERPSRRRIWSAVTSRLGSGSAMKGDSASMNGGSISSLDDSGNNHLRLADDAMPAEVNDQCPPLQKPLSRKSYKKFIGTTFEGYHDDGLHSHVFSSSSSLP
jgi:LNS2 (Lipin/Ned1/Smp2)